MVLFSFEFTKFSSETIHAWAFENLLRFQLNIILINWKLWNNSCETDLSFHLWSRTNTTILARIWNIVSTEENTIIVNLDIIFFTFIAFRSWMIYIIKNIIFRILILSMVVKPAKLLEQRHSHCLPSYHWFHFYRFRFPHNHTPLGIVFHQILRYIHIWIHHYHLSQNNTRY